MMDEPLYCYSHAPVAVHMHVTLCTDRAPCPPPPPRLTRPALAYCTYPIALSYGAARCIRPPQPTPTRIAFKFVVNLTIGLFMAVIQFLFSVWTIIWSYQPDPVSTLAFAAMASLAAVSLLATWLLGLAAVGVTGVYAVAKLAETAQVWCVYCMVFSVVLLS